jgi:hypothetical protein
MDREVTPAPRRAPPPLGVPEREKGEPGGPPFSEAFTGAAGGPALANGYWPWTALMSAMAPAPWQTMQDSRTPRMPDGMEVRGA